MFFMENPSRQILDDIASLIASVKSQISLIEEKLAELSSCSEAYVQNAMPGDVTAEPHGETPAAGDLFVDKGEADAAPSGESASASANIPEPIRDASFHIDAGDLLKEAEHLVNETGYVNEAGYAEETGYAADSGNAADSALAGGNEEVDGKAEAVPGKGKEAPQLNPAEHLAVMDVLAEKEAWKKDRPGMPVKDVRSAISLNDRALFIRSLFREDPLLFSQTLVRINSMDSLDQVEAALRQDFPDWNMESEVVYRFMMCVRRKVG